MSHFLSAIIKGNNIWYLTTADIESSRGIELRVYTKALDDLRGHGAVRWFYNMQGGKETEYRNFSTPDNIPEEIVKKVITGYSFCRWFGLPPPRILLPAIYTEGVKKAITLIRDYYKLKKPDTFKEYQVLMLNLQEEYWLKIRDKNNRMRNWRHL